ncbi:hypothetical protein I6G41_08365 [Staphylococcus equorum]|uniref:hypothetical protein n=1 Tax=Staphylococcus equorum TaxID=246432 RepID=UPI0018D6232A|nr:hypothetical protein [Staphylococcus equorum]QPS98525.1 hypothetical protein I6G41_08365 [Staphylococcus equorum]
MTYEYECEEVIKNVIKELIYFKKGKNELAEKEIDEIYTKAKAFDTFLKYNQHVEKNNNSDCHELERVFQGVIKEYEEDK